MAPSNVPEATALSGRHNAFGAAQVIVRPSPDSPGAQIWTTERCREATSKMIEIIVTKLPAFDSALRRYALYQIPGLLVAAAAIGLLFRWTSLPGWAAVSLVLIWVLKDAALYPWLRSAYESDPGSVIERLVGLPGVAVEPLAPSGYVRVRGELWQAEAVPPEVEIGPGQAIVVHAVRGTILVVRDHAGKSLDGSIDQPS